ncbi:MAG TPA: hypothetical protein VJN71_11190 [Nitrososphaerales archaeon]|nr:hypothetical protein [Nitrososphaerales archaeon]
MASESFPKWIAEEIQLAKFDASEDWNGSGYILDINKKERKIDVQFYEKLPEGRHIATLDLADSINPDSLELAIVYMFRFKAFKAILSKKAVTFLKEKYKLDMENLYRFELQSIEKLDAEADSPAPRNDPDEDE